MLVMDTLMLTAWFINSASRKATVEAMTSLIHVSTPVVGAEGGLDRWRLTVAKKIRKPMSCSAADVGSRRRQFHSLTLATQRRVTPPVQRDRKSTRLNSSH